jgi:hypothetical protein
MEVINHFSFGNANIWIGLSTLKVCDYIILALQWKSVRETCLY